MPVLETQWCERLKHYSQSTGPVIALLGFADRTIVAEAKAHGAVACIELPYDVDDLIDVIDRTARNVPPASWPLPARVERPHFLPPRPRRRRQPREAPAPAPAPPWSRN